MLILSQKDSIDLGWGHEKQFMVSVFGFQRSEHAVKPELWLFWTSWCACWELLRDKKINRKWVMCSLCLRYVLQRKWCASNRIHTQKWNHTMVFYHSYVWAKLYVA